MGEGRSSGLGAEAQARGGGRLTAVAWGAAILVLPLVMLPWLVPGVGTLTIGNDYPVHSILNQLFLQLSLQHGTLPLFVPGFAGGASAAALTLGQLYHPISHLAAALPGYADGRALDWNTWLRLVSLGGTQLALFALLRHFRLARPLACAVSLVTVYNLRMLDLFRYGASLEAYTAHLLLCASLLWWASVPSRRAGPAATVLSTYLLVVSGHPQMAYYGLVGAGVVWLLAPLVVDVLCPACGIAERRASFYLASGACVLAGAILGALYTLPFVADLLAENGGRVGQAYEWSTAHQDSWGGTLNNFVRPFRSDVHGAFGGSVLPLVAVYAPFVIAAWRRVPVVIWVLVGACAAVCVVALGSATPVHRFVWTWLPLQLSMRVPGRVTLLLPVLTMLVLAWALQDEMIRRWPRPLQLVGALAGISLVLGWFVSGWMPAPGPFSPTALRTIPEWAEAVVLGAGAGAVAALIAYTIPRTRAVGAGLLVAAIGVQTGVTLAFGTWVTARQPTPTLAQLASQHRGTVTYPFAFGWGMYSASVHEHLKHTFFAPDLARLYRCASVVATRWAAYERLERQRDPNCAVVEGGLARAGLGGVAERDPGGDATSASAEVSLAYNSFNRMTFAVTSDAPALLVLSFPYSDRWQARVDGERAAIHRANGNELAVGAPAGTSRIEFRYASPAAFAGMAVTLLASVSLLSLLAVTSSSRASRWTGLAGALLLPLGGALWLWTHVYGGTSLGTRYHWASTPASSVANVAFGRSTRSSSIGLPDNMHLWHSSRAVDGRRTDAGAAATGREPNPWWQVDLGQSRRIATIAVFEDPRAGRPGAAPPSPLRVAVGDDPARSPVVRVIDSPSERGTWTLTFPEQVSGRYVSVMLTGSGVLSLGEVEVYEARE